MMTIAQIKMFSKRQLRGNKMAAAGAMILTLVCVMLWSFALFCTVFVGIIAPATGRFLIPGLVGDERRKLLFFVGIGIIIASLLFIGLFLYSGLMLGTQKLYLNIAKGRRVSAFDVFKGFSDGAHLSHFFSVILIILLIQILIMVPETVIGIVYGKRSMDYKITSYIASFIMYIVALFLSMAGFASADHPEMGAWEAIGVSLHLMRKRKFKLMCLELSFIGWFVIFVITFGIAGLWIIPYFNTSLSVFYLSAYGQDYISTPNDVYVRGDAKPDAEKPSIAEAVMAGYTEPEDDGTESSAAEYKTADTKSGSRSFEEVRSEFTNFGGYEDNASADAGTYGTDDSAVSEGTAKSVTEVGSFLNAENNDTENSFGNEESDFDKTYDAKSDMGAGTIKPEEGLKKNYNTEEDAYAAYVQWKKDHGITIDNPDPFHNIHHKSNENGNAGEE